MNGVGKQSPSGTPLRHQIAHHANDSQPTPDRVDKSAPPYRHPQSFYFSGFPMAPANAPIVSQNYTNFAMIKPDPKTTWDQVNKLDPKTLPACQLFNSPSGALAVPSTGQAPSWGNIGK